MYTTYICVCVCYPEIRVSNNYGILGFVIFYIVSIYSINSRNTFNRLLISVSTNLRLICIYNLKTSPDYNRDRKETLIYYKVPPTSLNQFNPITNCQRLYDNHKSTFFLINSSSKTAVIFSIEIVTLHCTVHAPYLYT